MKIFGFWVTTVKKFGDDLDKAYQQGDEYGRIDGRNEGYDEGFQDGYTRGQADGYPEDEEGSEADLAETFPDGGATIDGK